MIGARFCFCLRLWPNSNASCNVPNWTVGCNLRRCDQLQHLLDADVVAVLPTFGSAITAELPHDRVFFPDWRVDFLYPRSESVSIVGNGAKGNIECVNRRTSEATLIDSYADYMYPRGLRLADDRQTLLIVVAGSSPTVFGAWTRTWGYRYSFAE